MTSPPRRKPRPSAVGDDYCFHCGKPGSTCPDCGEVTCASCNVNPYAPDGHEPSAHLEPPPVVPETEAQRLTRENLELERQLFGTLEDRLRKRHAQLKVELSRRGQP